MPKNSDFEINLSDKMESIASKIDDQGSQLKELQELEKRYFDLLNLAEADADFRRYCKAFKIPKKVKLWSIASALDGGRVPQTTRCKLLGIKYGKRDHVSIRDHVQLDVLIDLVIGSEMQAVDDDETQITDKMILQELQAVIRSGSRDTDKVKAIETFVKIRDKIEGDSVMKPFERVWMKIIGPAILSNFSDNNDLEPKTL